MNKDQNTTNDFFQKLFQNPDLLSKHQLDHLVSNCKVVDVHSAYPNLKNLFQVEHVYSPELLSFLQKAFKNTKQLKTDESNYLAIVWEHTFLVVEVSIDESQLQMFCVKEFTDLEESKFVYEVSTYILEWLWIRIAKQR